MANLTSSQVRQGEQVTVINTLGGFSIGYLVDGEVWATTGSYWAVKAENDVFGMAEYKRDGGATYMNRVRKL